MHDESDADVLRLRLKITLFLDDDGDGDSEVPPEPPPREDFLERKRGECTTRVRPHCRLSAASSRARA